MAEKQSKSSSLRSSKEPTLTVVIPSYNEAEVLAMTLSRTHEVLECIGESFEILVVDDGSTDDTWNVIRHESEKMAGLRGIRLSRNFGKENAICAGLGRSRGRAVIIMDADLQHPPEIIPQMIEKWRQGFQIIDGVKRSRGPESRLARLSAKTFYRLLGSLSDFDLSGASDFKMLDRQVVNAWCQMGERSVFFRGMSAWLGFNRASVEFEVAERAAGHSTWSSLKLLGLALRAITAFSSFPLRVVTFIAAVFMVISLLLALQTLYLKFRGSALTGFPTVIIAVLFSSSVLMFALGVIGEYIARIYEEVKSRPRYIVAEKCGTSRSSESVGKIEDR